MNKLEKYLKYHCISQRGFAKKLGTTPANLGVLVKGKTTPSLKLAYRIEKMTGGLVKVYDWVPDELINAKYEEIPSGSLFKDLIN
jgi:DNA-binding XRE family transcriptional regulator